MPSLAAPIERLVARLDALAPLTSATLEEALAATPIALEDVLEFAHFHPQSYRRNLVLGRPKYELRVLCWLPGQRTPLHGHDGSACAFRILSGEATEIRLGEPDNVWRPGDVVAEKGDNFVHQVTNLGSDPLVSIHTYAPALPIDQPPLVHEGRHVVIIGGGLSGAALAMQLLDGSSGDRLGITIVERRQELGRGPAFATSEPANLLNVPAEGMSIYPSRPDDFLEWARTQGEDAGRGALLPRRLFGEYVEDRLAAAVTRSRGKVWFHRTTAISASQKGVLLADGAFLEADAVVLATGNQLPSAPAELSREMLEGDRVIANPWDDERISGIGRDEEVLLLGTGLTAVDVLLALRNQGHRGHVLAVSRLGLLPQPHLPAEDPRAREVPIDPTRLPHQVRELARFIRSEAQRLQGQGVPWQCLIDGVRPHVPGIWRSLPLQERARFMTWLRPYWDVVRHRAAPEALSLLEGWRRAGKLEIRAGTLGSAVAREKRLDVELLLRGGRREARTLDRLVLCTGPETDVRLWRNLLFTSLLGDGRITPDPLGLGIVTDDDGRVVDGGGRPSPWLYALGGLRRPQLWESAAGPDIARQAESLAAVLQN